ncbi:MAG TPA: cytochrome c-type biogenesis protein [Solirubrobacteraceae bacterium]|nr:cytochrome c-type biogenesis protein [Solirubrobacteraceae bacterium]
MRQRVPHRPLVAVLLALALTAFGSLGLASSAAATARPSLTQLYGEFMCVECHESLAVAQSPESFSERQYIRDLIAQGETAAQIKSSMVASYGPAVLAVPPANGFNLLVYVLPPVLVALAILMLVFTIPRWRRRARQTPPMASAAALSPDDDQRLNDELGRYA